MKDYFGYNGKVCVVTGASSGMGKATTEMLVDLGAKVYALDLNPCSVEGIEKYIACNLSKQEAIDKAFKEIPEHIDVFFGVAGLSGDKTDYVTTFNCDFTSNKYMTENYLSQRMSEGGAIVYCTSTAGNYWDHYMKEQNKIVHAASWEEVEKGIEKIAKVAPANMAYVFAKRCLSQFCAEQCVEFGKKGIRMNNVMPGATITGMKDEFQKMAGGEASLISSNGIANRLAASEEMAMPMVFLGSNMATFVSGLDMYVDYTDNAMKKTGAKKMLAEKAPSTNLFILKMAKKMMEKQAKALPESK